jgi:nitrogen fixation NifU-like protein
MNLAGTKASLSQVYEGIIREHFRNPRNYFPLDPFHFSSEARNRLCGDQVKIYGNWQGESKVIEALSFSGQSCAICKASASLLTEALKGKTSEQATILLAALEEFSISWSPSEEIGEFSAFLVIKDFKTRHRCMRLPWQALRQALSEVSSRQKPDVDPKTNRKGE